MENSELEDTALELFEKLDVQINSSNIEVANDWQVKGQKESLRYFPNENMQTAFKRLRKT